jgi:hypothetical protein
MSSPFSLGPRKIAGNGSGRRLTPARQERQRTILEGNIEQI